MADAMPDSHWTNRTFELLEDFMYHNVVRKNLDPALLNALKKERERLIDVCFAQLAEEEAKRQ